MSKSKSGTQKNQRKKRVVTTATTNKTTTKIQPTRSRRKTSGTSATSVRNDTLIFGKQNYMWMGIGFGLIILGLLLMTGGAMPSPDVWDENIIYSFRRTVLAPFLMVVGLVIEVYAIFKK